MWLLFSGLKLQTKGQLKVKGFKLLQGYCFDNNIQIYTHNVQHLALVALGKVIKLVQLRNEVLDRRIASKSNTTCNHEYSNYPVEALHQGQVHERFLNHPFRWLKCKAVSNTRNDIGSKWGSECSQYGIDCDSLQKDILLHKLSANNVSLCILCLYYLTYLHQRMEKQLPIIGPQRGRWARARALLKQRTCEQAEGDWKDQRGQEARVSKTYIVLLYLENKVKTYLLDGKTSWWCQNLGHHSLERERTRWHWHELLDRMCGRPWRHWALLGWTHRDTAKSMICHT